MNDRLRYEKLNNKNSKLKYLNKMEIEVEEESDILINGLGFIRVTKPGKFEINIIDTKLVSVRKSMI